MSENKNIINFPSDIEEDYCIEIERTDDFLEKAKALSDHINTLPLTGEQHNKLVELTLEQTMEAERGGVFFGVKLGIEIGKEFGGKLPSWLEALFDKEDIKDIEK